MRNIIHAALLVMVLSATHISVGATVAAQLLAPKPHYLGAEPDLSASSISGVRLGAIAGGGPAEKAGLQVGDVILKLGSLEIRNPQDLSVALRSVTPGSPTDVLYLRQGREQRTQVSLEPLR